MLFCLAVVMNDDRNGRWRLCRQVGTGSGTKLDDTGVAARYSPHSGTTDRMRRGDALIFYSLHDDGLLPDI